MDRRLRDSTRTARQADDPAAWLEAARGLARAGAVEPSAEAVLWAARLGRPEPDLLEALRPASLEAFAPRVLGERFGLERIEALAFAPDASVLFAACGKKGPRRVVAFDLERGDVREVLRSPRRVRALGVDLDGRTLALCTVDALEQGTEVRLIDLERGWHEAPDLASREWFATVDLTGPADRLLTTTSQAARAHDRAAPTGRAPWSATGRAACVGPFGGAVVRKDGELRLFDPGVRRPRVRRPLTEVADAPIDLVDAGLHPAGAGVVAVLVALERRVFEPVRSAVWISAAGAARGPRVEVPGHLYRSAACPAGRYLAGLLRDVDPDTASGRRRVLSVVDLATGAAREVPTPALPGRLAWSAGGSRLAVGTDQGTVLLLDASGLGERSEAPAEPAAADGWEELVTPDRFWRIRRDGAALELHYGLRGAQGTRKRVACGDPARAERELAKRVRAKARAGYSETGATS